MGNWLRTRFVFERELVSLGHKFIGFESESQCYKVPLSQFQDTDAIIENYGLWDKSGKFRYSGENISIVNIFRNDVFSEELLEIKSLWEVAAEKSLETMQTPRILKMNIEGAERGILLRLITEPLDFDVLIFQAEFLFHPSFLNVLRIVKSAIELKVILKKLEALDWELIGFTRHQITLRKKINL